MCPVGGLIMKQSASIEEIVLEKDVSSSLLSKKTNLSQSNLWKTMNGQVPMTFTKLMKILETSDTEETKMNVIQRFLSSTDKEVDLRLAMYYLYLSGYTEILQKLLKKTCKQPLTRYYQDIFKVCVNRQIHSLRSESFLRELDALRAKVNLNKIEVNILVNMLSIYGYFDMGAYNILSVIQRLINDKIPEISNGLQRVLLKSELDVICAYAYLMQDEVIKSREILQSVLLVKEVPRFLKATALSIMAESYIFTDYQESSRLFKLSLEELGKIKNNKSLLKRKLVENTFSFSCIINRKMVELGYIHHDAELSLLYIFQKRYDDAAELLEKIPNRTAFQDLYLSVATSDEELKRKAYHRFLKEGNLFYIKIFDIFDKENAQ